MQEPDHSSQSKHVAVEDIRRGIQAAVGCKPTPETCDIECETHKMPSTKDVSRSGANPGLVISNWLDHISRLRNAPPSLRKRGRGPLGSQEGQCKYSRSRC